MNKDWLKRFAGQHQSQFKLGKFGKKKNLNKIGIKCKSMENCLWLSRNIPFFHFFLICDFVVVELSCLFGSLVEGVFVVVCDCICICCR